MSISKRLTALILAVITAASVFSFTAMQPAAVIADADFVAPVITIPDSMPTPDNNLMTNNVTYYLGAGTRWEQFVKADFLAAGKKGRGTYNYQKYIVVHNTGAYPTTSTSLANHTYGKTTDVDVSWHFTCGNDGIYQMIPVNEKGWHAGGNYWGTSDTATKTAMGWISDCSNSTAVGIETATPGFPATDTFSGEKWDSDEMYDWYANTFDSTATYLAELVAWLCVGMNFNPYTQVAQHYSAAAKNCPIQMRYVFGSGGKKFDFYGTYFKVFLDRMYDYYKAYGGSYVSTDTLKNQYYNPNTVSYKKGLYKSSSAVSVYRAGNTSTGVVGTVAANQVMDVQTIGYDWGRVVLSNGTVGWVKLSNLTYVTGSYRLGTYRTSSGSIVNVTNISGTTAYYDGGSTAISNLTKVYKVKINGASNYSSTEQYVADGTVLSITAESRPYAFDIWDLTTGYAKIGSKKSMNTSVTISGSDIVLTATYSDTFALTVSDGAGTGRYKAGQVVNIKASSKTGYKFTNWSVVSGNGTIADVNSASTTYTMGTGDGSIKANYTFIGSLDTVGLTNYSEGKKYTTTWKGSTEITYYSDAHSDTNLTKLTDGTKSTAGSTTSAEYVSFTGTGGTAAVTIDLGQNRYVTRIGIHDLYNNGASWGDIKEGSVSVEYSNDNATFTKASGILDSLLNSYNGTTAISNLFTHQIDFTPFAARYVRVSFTSNAYVMALSEISVWGKNVTTYPLTVENGTGSGNYAEGMQVTLTAVAPNDGNEYEFTGWTLVSGNGTFVNDKGATTNFITGNAATKVKANFKVKDPFAVIINPPVPPTFIIDKSYVDNTPETKTVKELKEIFVNEVAIKKPDGTVAADTDFVGTGYIITSGTESREFVVKGDLNSDASVSASDFIVLKNFISATITLTGAFEAASDCDGNGTVSASDYIAMAANLKG